MVGRRLPAILRALSGWRHRWRRDRKLGRRLRAADFVVVSLGKSGRTWLRAMVSHLYHQRHGIPEHELIGFDNFHRLDPAIPRILFTHDGPAEPWNRQQHPGEEPYRGKRVLLLVRDPRDTAVSMYFQHTRRSRSLSPEHATPADFLLGEEHGRLPRFVRFLNGWARRLPAIPGSLLVRYEDMAADPGAELRRVARFLGAAFSEEEIWRAVAFASFESLREKEAKGFFTSERLRPGTVGDPASYKVRRGKVGGWRDYVTGEEAERADAYLAAHLHPVYGYGRPAAETAAAGLG
jgi:hypothetical protein